MPGKLLSDTDLESNAALVKMETPRKQNEKVRPRAEGLGAMQDGEAGALRGAGRGVGSLEGGAGPACPEIRVGLGQGASGSSVLRGRWAPRRAPGVPKPGPGEIGTEGSARCPTWSRSLGAPQQVHRVGCSRLGPTFWLKLRPNSRRVACAGESFQSSQGR